MLFWYKTNKSEWHLSLLILRESQCFQKYKFANRIKSILSIKGALFSRNNFSKLAKILNKISHLIG